MNQGIQQEEQRLKSIPQIRWDYLIGFIPLTIFNNLKWNGKNALCGRG